MKIGVHFLLLSGASLLLGNPVAAFSPVKWAGPKPSRIRSSRTQRLSSYVTLGPIRPSCYTAGSICHTQEVSLTAVAANSPRVAESDSSDADADADADAEEDALMKKLDTIAHNLKLQVYDLDEGIYGFEPRDITYGIEVVRTEIDTDPSLGLDLVEMAHGSDGRGLVLISGVYGNAAASTNPAQVGDVITGVFVEGTEFAERTTGLNYDYTVEAIQKARALGTGKITLELDRLVKRARIRVEVEGPTIEGGGKIIDALAGENLRRLLLRKGIRLYDSKTKRFDMPYATGDCAGEGLCGTCLVNVKEGSESLSPRDDIEKLITKGRPSSWRAACRAVVGADNKEGTIKVQIHPQSKFKDELNPGVKSVRAE